jgi:hypothetical protein
VQAIHRSTTVTNPPGDEFPNIADFAKLFRAWTFRSFRPEDTDHAEVRLRQLWRVLANTIGGKDVLEYLEAETYDPMYVPDPIIFTVADRIRKQT